MRKIIILSIIYSLLFSFAVFADEKKAEEAIVLPEISLDEVSKDEAEQESSLRELVALARGAKDSNEFKKVYAYVEEAFELWGDEAKKQQAALASFPTTDQIEQYEILNNVAQCQFIKGEALKKEGRIDEAIEAFGVIVADFSYSQAFDPRGWYYKLAATSAEAIERMEGRDPKAEKCGEVPTTTITLYDEGTEDIVDYEAYGEFVGIGTKDYKYVIKDQEALSSAVGEGIYPNTTSVRWDPMLRTLKKEKRLKGSHWDYVQSPDLQAAFIKWALAPEPAGVKLFYTGLILEKSGLIKHAIKAYYASVVHFPQAVGWTYWHTPWYVAQAAIAKIKYLCKNYPELNMSLEGAKIQVENGFDAEIAKDVFIVNPGRLIKKSVTSALADKFSKIVESKKKKSKVKKASDGRKVYFLRHDDGSWQLIVEGRPYMIKAVTYAIAKVGQSPDDGSLKNWMEYDYNNNGKSDGPYDAFVDKNNNNKQDKDEPSVGDFKLMKDMGVNTIRLYHQPDKIYKEILRDMYEKYGIRVIMGDFLGKYALGSGAQWDPGTDYENEEHRKNMLESVKKMVLEFKDEPYILMWLLGNENVYGVACNADKKPDTFFKFVNEAALLIKSLDKDHPVAIASGDTLYLDSFAKHCPDVDAYAANVYRGGYGFGSYWESVKDLTDKPAFITEYGCPAYVYCFSQDEAEEAQADYLRGCWEDIVENSAYGEGSGNAVGGVLFEWLDEWWKGYEPLVHDTKGLWVGPFPDGYMHEEWLGVCGQGDGKLSPFLRHLRKSYYVYKELWKK